VIDGLIYNDVFYKVSVPCFSNAYKIFTMIGAMYGGLHRLGWFLRMVDVEQFNKLGAYNI
jgi:hypothetical protein